MDTIVMHSYSYLMNSTNPFNNNIQNSLNKNPFLTKKIFEQSPLVQYSTSNNNFNSPDNLIQELMSHNNNSNNDKNRIINNLFEEIDNYSNAYQIKAKVNNFEDLINQNNLERDQFEEDLNNNKNKKDNKWKMNTEELLKRRKELMKSKKY